MLLGEGPDTYEGFRLEFPNAPKIKQTTPSYAEEGTPAGEKPSLLFSTGTHVFMFMLGLINYAVTRRKMQVDKIQRPQGRTQHSFIKKLL